MPTPITSTSSPDIAGLSQHLSNVKLGDSSPYDLIDTDAALSSVVETLLRLPTYPPSIYIDLEGEKLSRHGTISIKQVYVLPSKRTHLIDIHILREKAFKVCGSSGQTLKTILESCDIPKVFFDVRNDSDALYKHYKISLAGIQDLQLMELATRRTGRKHVNDRYNGTLSFAWRKRVETASKERVTLSQSQSYVSHGRLKTLGPRNWLLL
ncbi:hypothetical protein BBAD15_g9057 [Beauveria bassiana D1-5]|uniref:3'-5' exonuclease domain-containing protein n=1 Tax=Beauveria bassiana D1-5 TaxID=1245745 RepID=A0A0A2VY93_BEABA|nr:hypothetical protein BBAD15_g9057 [Beauveria bassiana D1-5]